jgi:hypothetical protein
MSERLTPQELLHMMSIVRQLRARNPHSRAARKLEMEACIEMYMYLPLKTGGPEDVLFPNVPADISAAILRGILAGRAGDCNAPYLIRTELLFKSWEQTGAPLPRTE